jgi:hypothetical protein
MEDIPTAGIYNCMAATLLLGALHRLHSHIRIYMLGAGSARTESNVAAYHEVCKEPLPSVKQECGRSIIQVGLWWVWYWLDCSLHGLCRACCFWGQAVRHSHQGWMLCAPCSYYNGRRMLLHLEGWGGLQLQECCCRLLVRCFGRHLSLKRQRVWLPCESVQLALPQCRHSGLQGGGRAVLE